MQKIASGSRFLAALAMSVGLCVSMAPAVANASEGVDYYTPVVGSGSGYTYSAGSDYSYSYGGDYYYPITSGSDYSYSVGGDYYYGVGSDYSYGSNYAYPIGGDYYYPYDYGYSYYQTPSYSYDYGSYYQQPSYSYTYDYPSYHYTYSCADQGLQGTYPNCYRHQVEPVCGISASDSSIDRGDSTVLHWTSENATSASLSDYGSVSTGGSRTVSPSNTTTYTLRVYGQGGSDTCSVTVHVDDNHNNNLSCDLRASDRDIREGDDVTLRWNIDGNATYASINHGVGRVDEDGGSERVSPDEDTTYTLTVRDTHGDEDTCSVSINVDSDNTFSSATFYPDQPQNPNVVYLSSIPYTGLEDIDPTLLTYWALLIAAAGMGAWFLYRKGLIPQFSFATMDGNASAGEDQEQENHVEETDPGHTDTPAVASFLGFLTNGDTEAAVDELRSAAAKGASVEDFLAEAHTHATDDALRARLQSAYEASKLTGIRGAKQALA